MIELGSRYSESKWYVCVRVCVYNPRGELNTGTVLPNRPVQ